MKLRHYLFLLIFLSALSSIASNVDRRVDTLVISKDTSYFLSPSVKYIDSNNYNISFSEIISGKVDSLFKSPPQDYYIKCTTQINFWFRIVLKNVSANDMDFFLSTRSHVDSVFCYYQNDEAMRKMVYGGRLVEPSKRGLRNTKIKLLAGNVQTIYLRVVTADYYYPEFFPLVMLTPVYQVMAEKNNENLFSGLFYGVMLAVIFYCFMFAYFLKDRNYYLLVLVTMSVSLVYLQNSGYGEKYIWGNFHFLFIAKYGYSIFLMLSVICITLFSTKFMSIKKLLPKIYYLLWFFGLSSSFLFILVEFPPVIRNFTGWIDNMIDAGDYLRVAWLIMLLFSAVYLSIKKSVPALLFLICSLSALLTDIMDFFGIIDFRNNLFLYKHSDQIGFGITTILISISIGYNARQIRRQQKEAEVQKLIAIKKNEELVRGQNIMLEKKVVERTHELEIEKKKSDDLLLNILPSEVAEELKQKGSADAKQFDEVTVMFTDFKGFTQISEKLSPTELVGEIHTCFKAFDDIINKHNIEKIKTIGDSYMCAGGLPVANKTNATDVVNAAMGIQQFMKEHSEKRKTEGKELFEIRIGIHTGAVVAGIVGVKKFAYDIWGDTVNIASRMESSGEAGKVNISGSTYELVKKKFKCEHRGKIQAKNKGEIDMYFVEMQN